MLTLENRWKARTAVKSVEHDYERNEGHLDRRISAVRDYQM